MEKKIIIVAGEPSGDLQASLLISKIKELDKTIEVFAVGGEFLRKSGARIIADIKDLTVFGIFDVLKKYGKFKRLMHFILTKIDELKIDLIIFVDFSGFNLRLAKKINKKIKTVYYISPQVWASRTGRIKTIKNFIDKMIVIFKFEEEFYRKFGIEAEFIGHPLLDVIKPNSSREEICRNFALSCKHPIFTLLPGSRLSEIKYILPIMLKSAKLIKDKLPQAQFVISKPANIDNKIYRDILNTAKVEAKIIEGKHYDCLNIADFVLAASGTATLETAIMQKPNVVIYKMGILNYLFYRPLIKIPFIGIENIVAGKMIAPEFIQFKAKPDLIARECLDMFCDKGRLKRLEEDFKELKERLGANQASLRAAQSILAFINSRNNG